MKLSYPGRARIRRPQRTEGFRAGNGPDYSLYLKIMAALVIVSGLVFGAGHVYERLCRCSFFQITGVRIEGNRMTSKEQIAALSRVDIHTNLLAVDLGQIKAILESHPWIAEAKVIRDWPNRLLIQVSEKDPVALVNRTTGLFYLDSTGSLIAAVEPAQELDFPVITGLERYPLTSEPAEYIPEPLQEVFALLKLANRNNPILPEQNISEIQVHHGGELVLYLLDRPFPIYLGHGDRISTRYYRLVRVLKDLYKTQEFSEVSYIRLDYQQDAILVGKREPDGIHRG